MVVGLGLLRSYAGVGTALASCGAGCTCDPERFDLIHKALVRPATLCMCPALPEHCCQARRVRDLVIVPGFGATLLLFRGAFCTSLECALLHRKEVIVCRKGERCRTVHASACFQAEL